MNKMVQFYGRSRTFEKCVMDYVSNGQLIVQDIAVFTTQIKDEASKNTMWCVLLCNPVYCEDTDPHDFYIAITVWADYQRVNSRNLARAVKMTVPTANITNKDFVNRLKQSNFAPAYRLE